MPAVEPTGEHRATVRGELAQHEIRIAGGSFLIVYEGDLRCTKQGIVLLEGGEVEEGVGEDKIKGIPNSVCRIW